MNDEPSFQHFLALGDSLVRAISFILQGPWFSNSWPLNEALIKAVTKLLPYYAIGGADVSDLCNVLEAVGKTVVDWRALGGMIGQLNLNERLALQSECFQRAQMGNQFAINILPYI